MISQLNCANCHHVPAIAADERSENLFTFPAMN